MTDYKAYTTGFIVKPANESIFCEMATEIYIDDEAGGPFVVIKQTPDDVEPGKICVSREDWPLICRSVERLLDVCSEIDKDQA